MLEQRNVYTRLITTALSFLVFIQTRTKTVNENPLFKIKCLLDMFAWHVCLISIRKVDLLNAICVNKVRVASEEFCSTKAGEIPDTKPSTCRATLFRGKFLSMFPVFHLARSTCPATKTFVAGWRKVSRKVEHWSILALFLVFHRTHNLSRNKCRHIRSTTSKSTNQRAAFFQPAPDFIVARQVDHAK